MYAETLLEDIKRQLPLLSSAELKEAEAGLNLLSLQNRDETMKRQKIAEGKLHENSLKWIDPETVTPFPKTLSSCRVEEFFFLTDKDYHKYRRLIPSLSWYGDWWRADGMTAEYSRFVFAESASEQKEKKR